MRTIFFILMLFSLSGCTKKKYGDAKSFTTEFYPVRKTKFGGWERYAFFDNQPISIRLENRVELEDHSKGGFVPIIGPTLDVHLDRDLILGRDTIRAGSNLLPGGIAELEQYNGPLADVAIPDYYIVWINRQNKYNYSLNKGYYSVYISASTENQNQVIDSTTVFVR